MTAYNVVRFKVKSGQEQAFLDAHKKFKPVAGMIAGEMIETGDLTYCLVAKWKSFDKIVAARPQMIGMLDSFRNMLEDQVHGLGVTEAVSGPVYWNWRMSNHCGA